MLENQFTELAAYEERDKLKVNHSHQLPIFQNLLHKVSRYALNKIFEQYQKADEVSECKGMFTKTFGLPCQHQIREYKQRGESIQLMDVGQQWRLDIQVPPAQNSNVSFDSPRSKSIKKLQQRFSTLSQAQSEVLAEKIDYLLLQDVPTLSEPQPSSVKKRGRPTGSKNKSIL